MTFSEAINIVESHMELGQDKIGFQVDNKIDLKKGTGGMREVKLYEIPKDTRKSLKQIMNYLKAKKLDKKIAKKYETKTDDIVFNSDSTVTINFDDGGSMKLNKAQLDSIYRNY